MRVVDLFAGCGGLSLGFKNAGFEVAGAFEVWPLAANCYRQNFDHPVYEQDLSETTGAVERIEALDPDIIIGGPPCQDFSHAGKRVEGRCAGLTESYARIVSEIRPRWFVMENVARAQNSRAYALARAMLKAAGYALTERVLNASLCGVPQRRRRFFCVGSLGESDGFLDDSIEGELSPKETTLRDYFGESLDFEYYYRHPRSYNRRAIFSIDEPAPTVRSVNRPVPRGYAGHPNDACAVSDQIRSMTTLERSLVQTFPTRYKWLGSKTHMEQMIGNAVPVKLAELVARTLYAHIAKRTAKKRASTGSARVKRTGAICQISPKPDPCSVCCA